MVLYLHSMACKFTLPFLLLCPHASLATIKLNLSDYQYSKAEELPKLKILINKSLVKIFKTDIGREIARNILNCDTDSIQMHLGVEEPFARDIAQSCHSYASNNKVDKRRRYIHPSPLHALKKTTDSGVVNDQSQRTYSIIFTKDNDWIIDSWTNPSTNNTSIIIPLSEQETELDESRLIEVLAHETAIYFDSKFWTGSTEFTKIPGSKAFLNKFKDPKKIITIGLDNPLIAHSLAFIRAFKIELLITNELERDGHISFKAKDSERRRLKIESLLNCRALCLHNFIKTKAEESIKLSLPLIAYAPSYRISFWKAIESDQIEAKRLSSSKEDLQSLILDLPSSFYKDHSRMSIHILLEVMSASMNQREFHTPSDFQILIRDKVLPFHFQQFEAQTHGLMIHSSALDYMAEPLLSGYNTRMSSGPRPRIVVGGF